MQIIFLYGQAASGKLTIARELAKLTGYALFHNHLVVDAVAAIFPFGSEPFVRLRERIWMDVMLEAAQDGRSLIFTFAPEPTVAQDFPERLRMAVEQASGEVVFVALTLADDIQERRLVAPSRAEYGKLRSVEMLRSLRGDFAACMARMPAAALTLDTGILSPESAAAEIVDLLGHRQ